MADPERIDPAPEKSKSGTHGTGLRGRLLDAKETLEAGGLEMAGVGPMLFVWHKFGLRGLLAVILFVGFPVGQYSALRYAVYSGLPRMVGGFGLEFEAEEWALSPMRLRAVARNVKVKAPDVDAPIFTAGEVEFSGSAWTMLRGLPDMLTFHLFGGQQPFHEIVVRHGELHLERSLTGHLNLRDFFAAVPQARVDEALDGVYEVESVRLEDVRVTYIENIPGGSGDGIIRTAQAQVKVDEVKGTITDLVRPERAGERPTRFKLGGRSADGVFEVSGAMALFASDTGDGSASDRAQLVSLGGRESAAAGYSYEVSVYLENIAAGAYGRMVPVTTIVPVNGVIEGTTKIVRTGTAPECSGGFTMKNVRFAPNPLVLTNAADAEVVRQGLANVVYSGPFALCGAGLGADVSSPNGEPPASTMLASLTEQATTTAPASVKALVARDRKTMRGEKVEASVSELTSAVAGELGLRVVRSLGGSGGQVTQRVLASQTDSAAGDPAPKAAGNAVVSGVKGVGSGFKRLFGGKKKD
jgi:hypothetical protein